MLWQWQSLILTYTFNTFTQNQFRKIVHNIKDQNLLYELQKGNINITKKRIKQQRIEKEKINLQKIRKSATEEQNIILQQPACKIGWI